MNDKVLKEAKKDKPRVLYISDTLKQRFGVTAVIMNYLEHFDWNKIQIDLLVYENSEKAVVTKLEALGANVYYMPQLGIKNIKQFITFYEEFFKNHQYDIVHSHFNQVDGIIFKAARKNGVKKCISHSHNTKLSEYPLRAIRNRIMCLNIKKNADVWAACSDAAGIALFGKSYISSDKKLLVRNGVDCEKFVFDEKERQRIRTEFGINQQTILLGHVGSLKVQKNHKFLVEIFAELLKNNSRYKLILVGDGPTRGEIEKYINELGIANSVIFAGVRTDIPSILCAIDAFLLPSLYEGLPVIGIETQAAGLECVFSDTITKEVDLTGVHFVGLDEPIEKWVNTIEELTFVRKEDAAQMVTNKGYNIKQEAQRLLDYYILINQ